MAMVTANWRYSSPVRPPRKAIGTNTAHSTSTMAMTGPVTSCIALMAASRAVQVLLVHDAFDVLQHHDRVVDHDADGQHHAEQRERVDRIAEQQQPAKVPISDTGTASTGISVARQFCRNTNTTRTPAPSPRPGSSPLRGSTLRRNRVVSYGMA
jgi:hypothetical protein